MITLVVLVFWGLTFSYQQESSSKVIFLHLIFSHQQKSHQKVVDSSKKFGAKIPDLISKFETQFYSYSRSQSFPRSLQLL